MDDKSLLAHLLNAIRDEGIDNPNVELFIGVLENDVDKVKKALDDGANANITDSAVIEYHRTLLDRKCPEQLRQWTLGRRKSAGETVM